MRRRAPGTSSGAKAARDNVGQQGHALALRFHCVVRHLGASAALRNAECFSDDPVGRVLGVGIDPARNGQAVEQQTQAVRQHRPIVPNLRSATGLFGRGELQCESRSGRSVEEIGKNLQDRNEVLVQLDTVTLHGLDRRLAGHRQQLLRGPQHPEREPGGQAWGEWPAALQQRGQGPEFPSAGRLRRSFRRRRRRRLRHRRQPRLCGTTLLARRPRGLGEPHGCRQQTWGRGQPWPLKLLMAR
mmetsp:Transcript_144746/g.463873  ORF Transcript_144746/g.463873 Transcript_144746/m.463873 type:complete len:243 (+) Transcript_144746:655-1383(+)